MYVKPAVLRSRLSTVRTCARALPGTSTDVYITVAECINGSQAVDPMGLVAAHPQALLEEQVPVWRLRAITHDRTQQEALGGRQCLRCRTCP